MTKNGGIPPDWSGKEGYEESFMKKTPIEGFKKSRVVDGYHQPSMKEEAGGDPRPHRTEAGFKPESVVVLHECVELQLRKSADYQNPNSSVTQAMYYPNGVMTIQDIIWAKILRAKSLLESGEAPKNEALEDTFKDIVNYASFAVAWLRGKMDGQDPARDHLNRKKT